MSVNVETMFYTRVAPWHGLGVRVESAVCSEEALEVSGLNWNVIQRPIMTSSYDPIPGYKANIRDTDNRVLGVVTDRYRVVQNAEAFAFTDSLLVRASSTKRRIPCKMAGKSDSLPNSRTSISLSGNKSNRTLYSAVPMTEAARSRLP